MGYPRTDKDELYNQQLIVEYSRSLTLNNYHTLILNSLLNYKREIDIHREATTIGNQVSKVGMFATNVGTQRDLELIQLIRVLHNIQLSNLNDRDKIKLTGAAITFAYYSLRRSSFGSNNPFGQGSTLGDEIEKTINQNTSLSDHRGITCPHIVGSSDATPIFHALPPLNNQNQDPLLKPLHKQISQLAAKLSDFSQKDILNSLLTAIIALSYTNLPPEEIKQQLKELFTDHYYSFRRTEGVIDRLFRGHGDELENIIRTNLNPDIPHVVAKNTPPLPLNLFTMTDQITRQQPPSPRNSP